MKMKVCRQLWFLSFTAALLFLSQVGSASAQVTGGTHAEEFAVLVVPSVGVGIASRSGQQATAWALRLAADRPISPDWLVGLSGFVSQRDPCTLANPNRGGGCSHPWGIAAEGKLAPSAWKVAVAQPFAGVGSEWVRFGSDNFAVVAVLGLDLTARESLPVRVAIRHEEFVASNAFDRQTTISLGLVIGFR